MIQRYGPNPDDLKYSLGFEDLVLPRFTPGRSNRLFHHIAPDLMGMQYFLHATQQEVFDHATVPTC